MKKIYLLALICISGFSLNAQYTITSASNPVAGDIEHFKNLDTTGITLGSSGVGQTWNYSSATISTVATTANTFVPMSSVPNNTMFPSGTIGSANGSNYSVYNNNSSKIEGIGSASSTASNCVVFTDPQILLSLPASYGNSWSDTYAFSAPNYTVSGSYTASVDGTGTLQLPGGGTYSNVLKIKYLIDQYLTFPTSTSTVNAVENRFYSSANKFPLMTISTSTSSSTGGTMTIVSNGKSARMNNALITGITENQNEISELSVFPNPCSNGDINLTFKLTANETCDLTIFNSLGQLIKSTSYNGLSAGTIHKNVDLSALESGIYYLKLKTGTKEQTQKIAITR